MNAFTLHRPLKYCLTTLLWLLIAGLQVQGQAINITVNVTPPYPTQLDHYLENSDQLLVMFTNTSGQSQQFYVSAHAYSDNIFMSSREGMKPADPIELRPYEVKVFDKRAMEKLGLSFDYPQDISTQGLSQSQQDEIIRNRTLPEGTYYLCITAYDWDTDAELGVSCSNPMDVTFATAPVIIIPEEEFVVEEDNGIGTAVQWLPVFSNNSSQYTVAYNFQVMEINPSDRDFGDEFINSFFDARANIVYEETNLFGLSTIFFPQRFASLEEEKMYVMRVVAEDVKGDAPISNQGVSNLVYFRVKAFENELLAYWEVKRPEWLFPTTGHRFEKPGVYLEWTACEQPAGAALEREEVVFTYTVTIWDLSRSGLGGLALKNITDEMLKSATTCYVSAHSETYVDFSKGGNYLPAGFGSGQEDPNWFIPGNRYAVQVEALSFNEDVEFVPEAKVELLEFTYQPEAAPSEIIEPWEGEVLGEELVVAFEEQRLEDVDIFYEINIYDLSKLPYTMTDLKTDYSLLEGELPVFWQSISHYDNRHELSYQDMEARLAYYKQTGEDQYKGLEAGGHYVVQVETFVYPPVVDLGITDYKKNYTKGYSVPVDFYFGTDFLPNPKLTYPQAQDLVDQELDIIWSLNEPADGEIVYSLWIFEENESLHGGLGVEAFEKEMFAAQALFQKSSIKGQGFTLHEGDLADPNVWFEKGKTYVIMLQANDDLERYRFTSHYPETGYAITSFTYQLDDSLRNASSDSLRLANPVITYPLAGSTISTDSVPLRWELDIPEGLNILYKVGLLDLTDTLNQVDPLAFLESGVGWAVEKMPRLLNVNLDLPRQTYLIQPGVDDFFEVQTLEAGHTYGIMLGAKDTSKQYNFNGGDQFSDYQYTWFTYQPGRMAMEPEFVDTTDARHDSGKGLEIAWSAAQPALVGDSIPFHYQLKLYDLTTAAASRSDWTAEGLAAAPSTAGSALEDYLVLSVDSLQDTTLQLSYQNLMPILNAAGDTLQEGDFGYGHRYLASLSVSDPTQQSLFSKTNTYRSYAEPVSFTVTQDTATACELDCYYAERLSTTLSEDPTGFSSLDIGHFTIQNLSELSYSNSLLSGKGEIEADFLGAVKVKVAFSNVSVNQEGRIFSGKVTAEEEALPFNLSDFNEKLSAVDDSIGTQLSEQLYTYLTNGRMLSSLGGVRAVAMPLGVAKKLNGYEFVLGFTQMEFHPEQATVNLVASLHLPTLGEGNYLSLGASDICVNREGFGSEFVLHMAQDLNILADGELAFSLAGTSGDAEEIKSKATYMEVDCQGIKGFAIRGKVALPQSVVVAEDEEGEILADSSVFAHFGFELERGREQTLYTDATAEGLHWIAQVDLEPFQVKGVEGWGFEMDEAWLDMSDLANPDSLTFPKNYSQSVTDKTWTGFYLRKGYLRAPAEFTGGRGRSSVGIQDLIIDPKVSMDLMVTDVVEKGAGKIEGWGISLDTVFLSIQENALEGGGLKGGISMPVMEEEDYLAYSAIISSAEEKGLEYDFVLSPSDTLRLPMWVARADMDSSSYVTLHLEKDSTYLETFLKGRLGIDLEKYGKKDATASAPATVKLPGSDFQFKYHSSEGFSELAFGHAANGNPGSGSGDEDDGEDNEEADEASDASQTQNKVSGFPVSITQIDLESENDQVHLLISPSLSFMGGEEGFAAGTTLRIKSQLDLNADGLKKIKFAGIGIDSISLDAQIASVAVKGLLNFYKDENSEGGYDKGTRGVLNVNVPGIGLGINLAADFGTRTNDETAAFGTEDYFGYWYVDGLVYCGSVGLVLPPGYVTLHGLGGGVSVNMERSNPGQSVSSAAVMETPVTDTTAAKTYDANTQVQGSGIERVPSFGKRSLGFTLVFAVMRQELMNFDAGLEVSWAKNEGIQSISLNGNGYFFTPIADRASAQLRVDSRQTLYFPGEGEFISHTNLDAYMNFEIIKGGYENDLMVSDASLHYQNTGGANGNGYWDLVLGDYDKPAKAEINWAYKLDAETYFMAGHHVPTSLPELPDEIQQLLYASNTSDGDNSFEGEEVVTEEERDSDDVASYKKGGGLAHGASLTASLDLDLGIIYGDFGVTLAHDFNFTQDQDRLCYADNNTSITPGTAHGWYATGQVYGAIEGALGVQAKVFGKPQKIKIMDLAAAIMLQGGLPNPTWAEGRAGVRYSVLGGALEGESRIAFEFGEACNPNGNNALAEINFIAEVAPEGRDINPYSDIAASFHLPLDEVLEIPTTDEEGKEIIHQFLPYLHDISVTEAGVGAWTDAEEKWDTDHTHLRLRFEDPFTPKEQGSAAPSFEVEVVVRAKFWDDEAHGWVDFYHEDGSIWEETKAVTFRTGLHPSTFDDSYVRYSSPLNRQRYFLQDEVQSSRNTSLGIFTLSGEAHAGAASEGSGPRETGAAPSLNYGGLYFKQNMLGFFPESDQDGTYTYALRLRTPEADDIDIPLTNISSYSSLTEIRFEMPELENDAVYALQLVRQNTNQMAVAMEELAEQWSQQYSFTNQANDTYDQYQVVSRAASAPSLAEAVGRGEELLYVYYFATSAYNSLEEKLADAEISQDQVGSASLSLSLDEPFDAFDLLGATDGDGEDIAPRVWIIDPFDHAYHSQTLAPLLTEPLQDYEAHMASNPAIAGYYSYQHCDELQLQQAGLAVDWQEDMSLSLNESVSSSLSSGLGDAQIRSNFSALSRLFAGTAGKAKGLPIAGAGISGAGAAQKQPASSGTLQFDLDTHRAAEADAAALESWALAALDHRFAVAGLGSGHHYDTYFSRSYPAFHSWLSELQNREDALTNFEQGLSANRRGGSVKGASASGKSSGSSLNTPYNLRFQAEKDLSAEGGEAGSSKTLQVQMEDVQVMSREGK